MQDISSLTFDSEKHAYYIDGVPTPSVSKIKNLITVPSYLNNWIRKKNACPVRTAQHDEKVRQACDYGTESHDYIENFLKESVKPLEHIDDEHEAMKKLNEMSKSAGTKQRKKVDHLCNALCFVRDYGPYAYLERPIIGTQKLYAGTADIIGSQYIADWKTNQCTSSKFKKDKLPGYKLQTGAYAYPLGIKVGYVVHVQTGDVYEVTEKEIEVYYNMFMILVDAYYGKSEFGEVRDICKMWNNGYDYKEIFKATQLPPVQIMDAIKYFQFNNLYETARSRTRA